MNLRKFNSEHLLIFLNRRDVNKILWLVAVAVFAFAMGMVCDRQIVIPTQEALAGYSQTKNIELVLRGIEKVERGMDTLPDCDYLEDAIVELKRMMLRLSGCCILLEDMENNCLRVNWRKKVIGMQKNKLKGGER